MKETVSGCFFLNTVYDNCALDDPCLMIHFLLFMIKDDYKVCSSAKDGQKVSTEIYLQ